ncbi:YeeE/YedE family protein [Haliangium ochraceum]|uniref:Uncharacterized protein n=1 Tax=Haliangium ochraceum (strain DSM 14365 / JCM 11303 / SMP-2) TaxID=502025 RepID=D0LJ41_HALO1|nr:YeeE/YedE thiosulfate transporter family protein [Haliangium ochraceum]ACY14888.1 protein of unknown function DUF395 YeeE/YedE [Haliangium ochraceum DSM 14365]
MTEFTPIASTLGGVLIGLSAALLLLSHGKIAGISGITGGLMHRPPPGDIAWRVAFVAGLVGTGALLGLLWPSAFHMTLQRSPALLVVAGLLVGFGTRLGNGCTSGHGVCGISRLSPRSMVATATFMATGALTVFAVRVWFGGAL